MVLLKKFVFAEIFAKNSNIFAKTNFYVWSQTLWSPRQTLFSLLKKSEKVQTKGWNIQNFNIEYFNIYAISFVRYYYHFKKVRDI